MVANRPQYAALILIIALSVVSLLSVSLSVSTRDQVLTLFTSAPVWPEGSVVTASNISPRNLTLEWDPVPDEMDGITYFIIVEWPFPPSPNVHEVPFPGILRFEVRGLTPGETYTFAVHACKGERAEGNCSDGPSVIQIMPELPPLGGALRWELILAIVGIIVTITVGWVLRGRRRSGRAGKKKRFEVTGHVENERLWFTSV